MPMSPSEKLVEYERKITVLENSFKETVYAIMHIKCYNFACRSNNEGTDEIGAETITMRHFPYLELREERGFTRICYGDWRWASSL